eukprot:CAMPEP_0195068444 /NCGR_PEP_ID=MMETSP0448-20130528/13170_1 /TAXON_ID=66468 /ORGANISM="Heterocapsa triquestra, Strain CCMP 448" /LENGTH=125 /DNA_ID=CAMNT_0040099975 /DNA_START=42 /DNA_END=415 /DNA_ORIENTATION=+
MGGTAQQGSCTNRQHGEDSMSQPSSHDQQARGGDEKTQAPTSTMQFATRGDSQGFGGGRLTIAAPAADSGGDHTATSPARQGTAGRAHRHTTRPVRSLAARRPTPAGWHRWSAVDGALQAERRGS